MIRTTPAALRIARIQEKLMLAIGQHNIPGLRWLVEGFNYYDTQRVKEVGAERAAAEWIVRCGGRVRFHSISDEFSDYNALIKRTAELDPRVPADDVVLRSIYAEDASVTGFGCRHFENLRKIEDVHFVRCKNLHDFGLETMGDAVGDKLKVLEIDSCPRITEFGLAHVVKFPALKELKLQNLKSVHGKEKVHEKLKRALPNTNINFNV